LNNDEDILLAFEFDNVRNNLETAIIWWWVRIFSKQNRLANQLCKYILRQEFKKRILELNPPVEIIEESCRKLVYLLCRMKLKGIEVEPLRNSKGGNCEQKIRKSDNAKAYRMQVSQHGAGYHIHYWQTEKGTFEIAWIGPHDDFYIPE
jgi:hypothetical protein